MAKGSIGDVTMYRANGQQIARARNRNPKNPRSHGQLIQRAIMATVMQAYAAGKAILDHSFQGKSVPNGSFRRFLSVNAKALRAAVAADFNNADALIDQTGRVVAPGATTPTPWTYRVSEGSLMQSLFTVGVSETSQDQLVAYLPAPVAEQTVAQYAAANNLVAGDIYTIVAFGSFNQELEDGLALTQQQPGAFGFIRLIVKEGLADVNTLATAATLADVFVIDGAGTPIPESTILSAKINIDQVVSSATTGCLGVIRSREDSGLRSTCDLVAPTDMRWGIASTALLEAWSQETAIAGGSDLILEGANF